MGTAYLTPPVSITTTAKTVAWLALVLLLWPALALADDAQPVDVIRGASNQVLQQLNADPGIRSDPARLNRLIQEQIAPHVDFRSLSRLTLGKHWRQATPEQQSRFVEEFGTLLIRSYSKALASYANQEIEYLSSSVASKGRRGTVRTRIVESGRAPLEVDYSLRLATGGWKIFDVTIEGVSLAINYRSTFSQEIRNQGFDAVIDGLVARNSDTSGKITALQTNAYAK